MKFAVWKDTNGEWRWTLRLQEWTQDRRRRRGLQAQVAGARDVRQDQSEIPVEME